MRYYQKKLLADSIDILSESVAQIKLCENELQVTNLCSDITEYINVVKSSVIKFCGNDNILIKQLDELILLLEGGNNRHLNTENLDKQINLIFSSIKEELVIDEIEVAFFPYSKTMSDCLRPIYEAAKADPVCKPLWIPIPYYSLYPDGRKKAVYLDEYDDIECVDWRAYDLAKRRPDIVFIHNIYDANNHITQVHEKFYTYNLKPFTDCLVFVPYGLPCWFIRDVTKFDLSSHDPEDFAILPHFCLDLLVCANESYRDSIVKEWDIVFETFEHITKPPIFYDRFVALGTPKMDEIFNLDKKIFKIPDCWYDKIYRTENDKKTTILLNTTLKFMGDMDVYFNRLSIIYDFFKNNEDYVLLWRPHPHTLKTVDAMQSQFSERFNEIYKKFEDSANVIIDTTDDFHLSFQVSDGYYGDESSLIYLYLATGKPFGLIWDKGGKWGPPVDGNDRNFDKVLNWQINNMKKAPGADIYNRNVLIWWGNFIDNKEPETFLKLFCHYVKHQDEYIQTTEYKRLKKELLENSIANCDGTASLKILHYAKEYIEALHI
jgi:hypothetical protein